MNRRWLTLFVLTVVLTGGCLRLEQEYPERMSFVLTTERTSLPPHAVGQTLRLSPLRILPPFNRSAFIYRYDAVRFEADHYNQFLSPPDQLLYSELQRWLAASGLFARVLGRGEGRYEEDLLLEGLVTALYGDYQNHNEPRAVMAIDFALYGGARPALLWRRSYRRELPLAESTAAALAISWQQGLAQILIRLEEDLAQTIEAGREAAER
jgi:cholesterol transport system auxiliary component